MQASRKEAWASLDRTEICLSDRSGVCERRVGNTETVVFWGPLGCYAHRPCWQKMRPAMKELNLALDKIFGQEECTTYLNLAHLCAVREVRTFCKTSFADYLEGNGMGEMTRLFNTVGICTLLPYATGLNLGEEG